TPGPIRADVSHVEAENAAYGVEFSARRLVGRWTTGVGYGYGVSEMRSGEIRYRSPSDVRHTVDVTSAYRFDHGLRVGAAFSASSGVPYTRIVINDPPRLEEPNAERTPVYASLDLMVDYTTE